MNVRLSLQSVSTTEAARRGAIAASARKRAAAKGSSNRAGANTLAPQAGCCAPLRRTRTGVWANARRVEGTPPNQLGATTSSRCRRGGGRYTFYGDGGRDRDRVA